jgi:chromosome segregation ATPase
MGGGNPKRIKKIWAESEHEALEGQMVREHVDLPTEFEEALHATKHSLDELAKRMYNHAQEIAESRVRETITAARKAKESAEFEVAEAMDTVNSLDDEKQELTSSLEKTWHQLQEVNADNTRFQERIDTLSHQVKEAEEKHTQMRRINIKLEVKKEQAEKNLQDKDNKLQMSRKAEEAAKMESSELKGKLKILESQAAS